MSSPEMHQWPLDYAGVVAESVVDPILVFETGQGQILRDQLLIPSLPTPQKKQLSLYKLFDCEQRLQEAVDAATPRHAPKYTGKKKKQGNRLGIYKCQFCDFISNRSFNTKQHEKTHSDPPTMPHKCIICERGFVRKYDLKVHHQMHVREIRDMMKSCGFVLV
ncbi:hypothetical protein BC940DRAFT_336159 [Gongronella butleri]|nr:hypothetical protein BC940DRAFT_336159 [Gongronella butleri]